MKRMRCILFAVCSLISVISLGQNSVQFQNKALQKVLQENGVPGFSFVSEMQIADSIKKHNGVNGKFFEIQSDGSKFKYIYVGRVNSCRAGGCSLSVEIFPRSESEFFDYFILFDQEKTVQLVKVFNYQATHGHAVTAKGWLKQFIGHDETESLQVNRNIDAISGATISVYAITCDIELKTKLLNLI